MTQQEFLSKLSENKDCVLVGSLGSISKDLSEIDHPNKILVKGAMGCAMAVALGYALHSDKMVICLIGDGSFLMKMGTISTILRYKPKNLKVIVLNNNSYASCGGQETNFKCVKDICQLPETFSILDMSKQ